METDEEGVREVPMTEQLSLFDTSGKWDFAQKLCDELNKLETVWKGCFFVSYCDLEEWTHVNLKNKVLNICISAFHRDDDSNFMQFKGDPESQRNLANCANLSEWIGKMTEDKDFSLCITPWNIYVYYHNFEVKKLGKW